MNHPIINHNGSVVPTTVARPLLQLIQVQRPLDVMNILLVPICIHEFFISSEALFFGGIEGKSLTDWGGEVV